MVDIKRQDADGKTTSRERAEQETIDANRQSGGEVRRSRDPVQFAVGDVLGVDVPLPQGLERLNGWLVYKIFKNGTPALLEPLQLAPVGEVSWIEANNHIRELKRKGHDADLWSEFTSAAIYSSLNNDDVRRKSGLLSEGPHRIPFWENRHPVNLGSRDRSLYACVCYMEDGSTDFERIDSPRARVRASQVAPELLGPK